MSTQSRSDSVPWLSARPVPLPSCLSPLSSPSVTHTSIHFCRHCVSIGHKLILILLLLLLTTQIGPTASACIATLAGRFCRPAPLAQDKLSGNAVTFFLPLPLASLVCSPSGCTVGCSAACCRAACYRAACCSLSGCPLGCGATCRRAACCRAACCRAACSWAA